MASGSRLIFFVTLLVFGLFAGVNAMADGNTPKFKTEIEFFSPEWNRDSWARITSDLDSSKQRIGRYRGQVMGISDGEAVRVLCAFEGFAVSRLIPLENGNYRRLNRETIIFTDAKSGEVLEKWTNPWTEEVVDVVHVSNDPFNYNIATPMVFMTEDIGGDKASKPVEVPLILPWRKVNDETLSLETDLHLFYPNSLTPEKWPRESSGPMVQASEVFRYFVPVKELEDPSLTTVSWHGTWTRIQPWLPWMLLGDKAGHVLYVGVMASADSVDEVSPNVLAYIKEHFPDFLNAPTEDYGPSLSSIEDYARKQTPAPVKDD